MEQQFKVGDKVVCVDAGCTCLLKDKEYTVQGIFDIGWYLGVHVDSLTPEVGFLNSRFKLSDKTPKQLAKDHLDELTMKKFKISEEYRAAVVAYEHFDEKAAQEQIVEKALDNFIEVQRNFLNISNIYSHSQATLWKEEAKLHNMTYCS